jgi:4'-phosphopantetheinyl transferase superfamily
MAATPAPLWPSIPSAPGLRVGVVDVIWIEVDRSDKRAARALREVLGRYLGADPGSLRFATEEGGKPRLEPPDALRFNLSHSSDAALCAVSIDIEVGVDLELRRRRADEVAIARRVFGRQTAEELAALDPDAREREFLLAWVRHEASLKCRGAGILSERAEDDRTLPWVTAWELGLRGAAALACETEPSEVRRWRWPAH